MRFVYDDGGRAAAGYKGDTRDCVTRAIAIATERPYQEIYDRINEVAQSERRGRRRRSSARTGVHRETIDKVMDSFGWTRVPTMTIGSGCTVRL